jgi:hypothetical protein
VVVMTAARQYLKAGNITREAECPEGHGMCSMFLGVTANGWLFRCKKPHSSAHLFNAEPDKTAPTNQEGVEKWRKRRFLKPRF